MMSLSLWEGLSNRWCRAINTSSYVSIMVHLMWICMLYLLAYWEGYHSDVRPLTDFVLLILLVSKEAVVVSLPFCLNNINIF